MGTELQTKHNTSESPASTACPICGEDHSDIVEALGCLSIHRELRKLTDTALAAELIYAEREVVEAQGMADGADYARMMGVRRVKLQRERDRRRKLARLGAPAYRPGRLSIPERIQRAKAAIDILAVADLLGLAPSPPHGGKAHYHCPVHGARPGSTAGVLYLDEWRWYCFGCVSGGSAFDLVIAMRQAHDFMSALEWLEARSGLPPLPASYARRAVRVEV